VRADFGATLAVKEVVLDEATWQEVRRHGLRRVAELSLALASTEKGIDVLHAPGEGRVGKTPVCSYAYATERGADRVRVVVLDTGTNLFEITVLMTHGVTDVAAEAMAGVQDAFVEQLRW
jgi:hypothetical protein